MQKKSKIIVGASVFIIFCISLMTFFMDKLSIFQTRNG